MKDGRGYQRRAVQIADSLRASGFAVVVNSGKRSIRPLFLLKEFFIAELPLSVILVHSFKDFYPKSEGVPVYLTSRFVPPGLRNDFFLDFIDATSASISRRSLTNHGFKRSLLVREAKLTATYEKTLGKRARRTFAITNRDADALGGVSTVIPMYFGTEGTPTLAPNGSPNLVFFGIFGYGPNDDAALWIDKQAGDGFADIPVTIYGKEPTRRIRKLKTYFGEYRSLDDIVNLGSILICPIVSGAGLQTKVLEAAFRGVPCIVTPFVSAGLSHPLPAGITVCDLAGFRSAVVQQSQTDVDRKELTNWVLENYGEEAISALWVKAMSGSEDC